MFKTVAARGFVMTPQKSKIFGGPVLPARGIVPKGRSFEHIPSYSSFLLLTEKYSASTFDHIRKDAAEFIL